jgi:O-6-methylguanine DNA methyltransferase
MERVYYDEIKIPWGSMWAASTDKGLLQLSLLGTEKGLISSIREKVKAELIREPDRFKDLHGQLEAYFKGKPVSFNIDFDLRGTEFQKDVWRAIHDISYGYLSSYGLLAREIGRPRACRAVGNAVGDNPIGVVIPCHRVVWSNGGLGGFGGGLYTKRRLLTIEGVFKTAEGTPEKDIDLRQFFKLHR